MEIFKLFGTIALKDDGVDKRLDEIDKKGNKVGKTFGGMVKKLGGFAIGAAAVGASIATAIGIKAVNSVDDLQQAMNGLQTQTGSTEEEMVNLEKSVLNIYRNNFGESFQDIADSMANIKQVTGLAGAELESTTQNALMFRDTFGKDVGESVNTVNSLMKQFGISSDEAFTLMAQGIQQGADKNEDFLDSLNEYAPQFKALGFNAEQFISTLVQGAENGAFSIDKVGDAVKEFNIRSKDMSKASLESFEMLGMNGEEMSKRFAQGGESAQEAFKEVMNGLASVEDPLLKNQIGVGLFGTMFEDLEADAITAMANIDNKIDMTADTLEQINEIKYDSFKEAFAGIGRQLETGFIVPLGKKLLPYLSDFANWISDHMPQIQSTMETTFNAIGMAIDWIATPVQKAIDWMKHLSDGADASTSNIKFVFTDLASLMDSLIHLHIGQALEDLEMLIADVFGEKTAAAIDGFIEMFRTGFGETVQNVGEKVNEILPKIQQIFSEVFGAITNTVLPDLVAGFSSFVKGTIPLFNEAFTYIAENIMPPVIEIIQWLYEEILPRLSQAFRDWIPPIMEIMQELQQVIKVVLDKILERWNQVFPYLQVIVEYAFDQIKNVVDTVLGVIQGIITTVLGIITGDWEKAWEGIKKIFSSVWEGIQKTVDTEMEALKKFLSQAWEDLKTKAKEWATNMVAMFVEGITEKIESVKTAVGSIGQVIADFLGFHSPTKEGACADSDTWMPNFVTMLSRGIDDNAHKVKTSSESLAQKVATALDKVNGYVETTVGIIEKKFNLWKEKNKDVKDSSLLLSKQLEMQKEKHKLLNTEIENTQQALQIVAQKYGENSTEAMGLQSKLLDLQIAQASVKNEMNETAKAINQASTSLKNYYVIASKPVKEPKVSTDKEGRTADDPDFGAVGTGSHKERRKEAWSIFYDIEDGDYASYDDLTPEQQRRLKNNTPIKNEKDFNKHLPKFHDGGWVYNNLKKDEVPAILQTGEYVLSRGNIKDILANKDKEKKIEIHQIFNFSGNANSPSEIARQSKNALRQWGLQFS